VRADHASKQLLRPIVQVAVCEEVVSSIVKLEDVELIPVLQCEPFRFAAEDRLPPAGTYKDMPEEWDRYWRESMADSGIKGLTPIEPGSWHVPTSQFTNTALLMRVLEAIFHDLMETGFDIDLGCTPLLGGLALRSQSQVLVEPGCCADLGELAGWRKAVDYRQVEWRSVSNGHPWVLARYDPPRLILSEPQEGLRAPTPRWAVRPDRLRDAAVAAAVEIERFSDEIIRAMPSSCEVDPRMLGRRLAGLNGGHERQPGNS
jgi:hypothetical protein